MKPRASHAAAALLAAALAAIVCVPLSSATTSEKADGCGATFKILAPAGSLTNISGRAGIQLIGSACDGDNIFVFDRTVPDTSLHRDNDAPLKVVNGRWRFDDWPIGDKMDPIGTIYEIIVVRAGFYCAHGIGMMPADVRALPSPCPDVNGKLGVRSIQVEKTRS